MKTSRFTQIMAEALALAVFCTSCGPAPDLTLPAASRNSTITPFASPTATSAPSATFDPYPPHASPPSATPHPYPLDAIPPSATLTATIPVPATSTPIPESWKPFNASTLKIQFRYPAEWQAVAPLHLKGRDGFVEISLLDYPASFLPTLGLSLAGNPSFRMLHSISANATLLLVGVHFALIWNWVVSAVRHTVVSPLRSISFKKQSGPALVEVSRD